MVLRHLLPLLRRPLREVVGRRDHLDGSPREVVPAGVKVIGSRIRKGSGTASDCEGVLSVPGRPRFLLQSSYLH